MTYPNPPYTGATPPAPPDMGSTNTMFNTTTWFDPSYLRTVPGILKCVVIVLNLIGFICIQSSVFWSNGRGVFFNIVAHIGIWGSSVLLLMYLFHVIEKLHKIKWLLVEMIAYVVMVFLYLIASTIVVAFGAAAYSAAGFFGYLAMVAYGSDAFVKFQALKAGALAQGSRELVKPRPACAPPALP